MKVWIVCTGEAQAPGRCTGAEFEAWMAAAPEREPPPYADKPMQGEGQTVLVPPGLAARRTAEQLFPGSELREEPLLAPIPERAFRAGGLSLPFRLWRQMAKLQRNAADPRQPESRRQALERVERLIARLETEGDRHALVADTALAALLMDRLRLHSCSFARTGLLRLRPYERILATGRDLHCGGCQHNCFLSSPGCGIGRDKAARLKQGYKA